MPKYAQLIQRSFKFQKIRWIPILKKNCNYKFDREQTIHRFYTNNVGRSWSCLEKTSHLPGDSTTMIPITRNEQREKGSLIRCRDCRVGGPLPTTSLISWTGAMEKSQACLRSSSRNTIGLGVRRLGRIPCLLFCF